MTPTDVTRTIMEHLRLITVEPIMFIISMTTYMRQPSNQLLVLFKVCFLNYNGMVCNGDINQTIAVENDVQADAAYWNFYLKMAMLIPGVIVSSLYGPLSDKIGRRIFLIIPSIGNIFGAVVLIFQSYVPLMPLEYIIASEVIVGLSGNVVTTYIVSKSYLCDVTDRFNRTKRMGVIKAMSYFGGPFGAFFSGVLIDNVGFASVYYIILAIHVFIVVYVMLWLKETIVDNFEEDDEEEMSGEDEERDEEAIKEEKDSDAKEKPKKKKDDRMDEATCGTYCASIRRVSSEVIMNMKQMLLVCFRERLGFRRKHLLLILLIGIIHNIGSTG